MSRRLFVVALLALSLIAGAAPAGADHDEESAAVEASQVLPAPAVDNLYPMPFPVQGENRYTDTWHAPRGGGRVHLGTDILADKMTPVIAVADGTIGWVSSTCCTLQLNHDDGWSSWYIHLNNDTPGTDDGLAWGIADGLVRGSRVRIGETIGWVGDSGNAEHTTSHLHFELYAPGIGAVNSYPHLQAAWDWAAGPPVADPCPDLGDCDVVAFVDAAARFHVPSFLTGTRYQFFYGTSSDLPVMGDWDCDGVRTPAMYRPASGFVYLRNTNTQGVAELEYFYGLASDVPLAGDWDGDGCDSLAIYRPGEGKVYVKNSLGTGVAEFSYFFGVPGDEPFVGDFDGDGVDTVGLYRPSSGFVYLRNSHTTGAADREFYYGLPGDSIVAGDWDGDGDDTVAAYRPSTGTLYVSFENDLVTADVTISVGDYRYAVVG